MADRSELIAELQGRFWPRSPHQDVIGDRYDKLNESECPSEAKMDLTKQASHIEAHVDGEKGKAHIGGER